METGPRSDGSGLIELLQLFRHSPGLTRAEVAERTGWARMTVNNRLDELVDRGLLHADGATPSRRGRPASRFRFAPDRGLLLVADIGASGMRLAVCDLGGAVLHRVDLEIDVRDGPDPVLSLVEETLGKLLAAHGAGREVWGVGVSLPGPVEFATGRVVSPPIMTGWDGAPVSTRLRERFGAEVFVDNDVNAMALGEQRRYYPEVANLLFLKVGTGVGSGIVANGHVLRGAQGAAGDIGHTWADSTDGRTARPVCQCGKIGCVEAYAGGWAILRDLAASGRRLARVDELVEAIGFGDPAVIRLVREAGRVLGAGLAHAVSLLNPSVLVVGGQLAKADEHLLAGIRELIYARSLPLATRDLRIVRSRLGDDAGVIGLAHGLADAVLGSAATVDRLSGGGRRRTALVTAD